MGHGGVMVGVMSVAMVGVMIGVTVGVMVGVMTGVMVGDADKPFHIMIFTTFTPAQMLYN